jgi:hypothetical protein
LFIRSALLNRISGKSAGGKVNGKVLKGGKITQAGR